MDKHNESRLREGYERLLERVKGGSGELDRASLEKELDDAVEFESELAEYTKDELALLRVWVERDLRDMRSYLGNSGRQVAEWLGIDLDHLSRRVSESLLSIADRSVVERERFNEDLEAARADYCEGEMAAPGKMACTHCDAEVIMDRVQLLEPCHQCGSRYFMRLTATRKG
ncbi:zinc ribbon-containing protein [Halomonas garicola]|uniref:zinc ribbon-containing protein n=1 Tax=Halomonas garicola TaxID=1690008 RepID=UPI00289F2932|nr:hypothetical protein [Halomonas garicola]